MNKTRWVTLACLLVLAGMVLPAPGLAQTEDAVPVIIDTDMGPDDMMAILFLLQQPTIDVQAITVTGTGLAYCDGGVQIALGLLELAGNADVPVTCGRETPLEGDNAFPEAWRTTLEVAEGMDLPENANAPVEESSVDLLTSIVQESEVPVRIVALGPLTNLAEAFDAEPGLIENIEMIYVMGGAVDVPGSYIEEADGVVNETAEWNIYCDPLAAAQVVDSGAPLTFVPLDATNHVLLTMDFLERLEGERETPESEFVYTLLASMTDYIESGGYYFWDPLAAAIAVDESLATIEDRTVTVVTEDGPENGRILPGEDGSLVRVAVDADAEAFDEAFLGALNAPQP